MNRIFPIAATAIFVLLFAGCTSQPKEVGVFLKTKDGWSKLSPYDLIRVPYYTSPGFADSYIYKAEGTQEISRNSFPSAKSSSTILINKVPLDPSSIFLGEKLRRLISEELGVSSIEQQPLTALFIEQGVYEISIKGLEVGLHALVVKGKSQWRTYFFNIM